MSRASSTLRVLALAAASGFGPGLASPILASELPPNFVILFADDLGWGDLSSQGHPTIRTPRIDRMAEEGIRFTQFYSAAEVCTPSRAALLTGRLPVRIGMCSDSRRVLFPDSTGGLPAEELTLAECLRDRGYATACIGKWHLGHRAEYLPGRHGFDRYFGVPYSNDMENAAKGWPPTPLLEGDRVIDSPVDQRTLTRRYTEEAVKFIRESRARPFFLYLPYTFPHVPLHASEEFRGKSARGLYGDVVEELDASVGRILDALRDEGLDARTYVTFSSDNGPWLSQGIRGGSAGLLREGKGSTWEGGMRVPGIVWAPGRIAAGRVSQALVSTLDLFPTFLALAGGTPPPGLVLDGVDQTRVLLGEAESVRDEIAYYRGTRLMAYRRGPWKLHFITQPGYGGGPVSHDPPLLFHLGEDPSEAYDVGGRYPEVVADLASAAKRHAGSFVQSPCRFETPSIRVESKP